MPINVQCPQCSRQLGVPDTLIGKKVKCPSCQTVFTAEEAAATAPPPPPPGGEEEYTAPRPASSRGGDEGGAPSGDQEKARAMVNLPAIALIVLGILGILTSFGWGCGGIAAPSVSKDGDVRDAATLLYSLGCCSLLDLIPCGLAIFGGIKMRSLQNFTMARVGSIAAMLTFTCCMCVPGIAVGIWSLIVLNNPEVKAAFRP